MNWETFDAFVKRAHEEDVAPELLARQIHSSSVRNPYYNLMRLLAVAEEGPGVFLEIGVYYGCVGAHINSVGTNLLHVGIDLNPVPYSHSNSILLRGDSVGLCDNGLPMVEVVKRIADKCGGIQYVFQDSSHHYEASRKEWELYSPMVKPRGLWLADDITGAFKRPEEEKGMLEYFMELPVAEENKRLYPGLHVGNAIGVVRL